MVIELQAPLGSAAQLLEGEHPLVDAVKYPNLSGGISIGPLRSVVLSPPDVPSAGSYVFVGTLGAMVSDRTTGATMALTNFHVACVNRTWAVGDRMVQQSRVDGGTAADQFGSLTRATVGGEVDAAVIAVDSLATWTPSVAGVGDVHGQAAATIGMAVTKRGRTTERTFGTVVSTDFSLSIDYGSDVGAITFVHQLRIQTDTTRSTRFSDHGDSGSVIMNDGRDVVGLLFAGSNDGVFTFANPITSVLDALNVDLLLPHAPIPFSKPLLSCFATKLTTLCGDGYVSKLVVCVSKFNICVTKSIALCPSKLTLCLSKVICPTKPILCRIGVPDFPDIPIEIPGGRFGYGQSVDPDGESYWAGYLTALEELAVADAESADGSDGSDENR